MFIRLNVFAEASLSIWLDIPGRTWIATGQMGTYIT